MLDHSKSSLLHELERAGAKIKADGREILCPFHDDKHASGGVYEGDDGIFRYKCHAASCGFHGDAFDVLARSENRPLKDVLTENNPTSIASLRARRDAAEKAPPKVYPSIDAIVAMVPGELEARYTYANPTTKDADLVVLRYRKDGKKQFWQVSRNHAGWVLQRPEGLLPLYNRTQLADARSVLVVEGEKCVHALRSCNHVGTTSPMGAGKAKYADWSPLAGKTVYLWPDNDPGGLDHMRDVAALCDRLNPPACVYWIEPAGLNLPEKGDVADFIEGKTPELARAAVAAVLDTATALGAARELEEMMEATIDGRRAAVSWPWESVTSMTKALLPGTVTLFCGAPGTSKSFAIMQVLRHWYALGVPAVVFELEEDRAYHLNRLLAQECGNAGLVDPDWVREHGAEVRAELQKHRALLNAIGRMIYAAPQEQIDYRKVVEWTQARANEGFRLIVIDPVTAVSPQRDVWVADSEFMFRIKTIAREKGCSIVLVTHPRKGVKKSCGMDDLAGGAAFQRFSQTLLWLEAFKDPKPFVMRGVCGRFTGKCNRVLHLMKCRNGRGTNGMIGMMWRGNDLCLAEQGVVVSESRQKKGEPPPDEGDPWSPEPGDKEPDDRWHF
jgi:hypothetical protein